MEEGLSEQTQIFHEIFFSRKLVVITHYVQGLAEQTLFLCFKPRDDGFMTLLQCEKSLGLSVQV